MISIDFAPNCRFSFRTAMDAEYAVIGRVARRIWARAMRDLYHRRRRSQMLKYHIQTSGVHCTRRKSSQRHTHPSRRCTP